jgi:hypothetical protein
MKIVENNKPLAAIVGGFEGGGTTMLSQILREHPRLDSGFEGGFLLAKTPKDFLSLQPYARDLKNLWNLSDPDLEEICSQPIWPDVYRKLRELSPVIENKESWIFDKTPRYMAYLTEVLQKVPNVPCIILVRDPRAVFWTRVKRTYNNAPEGISKLEWMEKELDPACNAYLAYAKGWQKAVENEELASRILLVQYESLCLNTEEESKRLIEFLGLKFYPTILSFDNKDPRYHPCRGKEVSTNYLTEYKQHLSEDICQEIVEKTSEFKDWLWND